MSTHNIGSNEEIAKLSLNYHQISSNTHLISYAVIMQTRLCDLSRVMRKLVFDNYDHVQHKPGSTTKHRRWLEAGNFRFRK